MKKYLEFINESLMMSNQLEDILNELFNKDIVANVLLYLKDSDQYSEDSEVNWLSLTNVINMLKYPPKNKRNKDNSPFQVENQTEVRIGRLVRKIINTCPELSFTYKGKAIFVNNNEIEFRQHTTGKDFYDENLKSEYYFVYDNYHKLTYTSVIINNSTFTLKDIDDQVFKILWDENYSEYYYKLILNEPHNLEGIQDVDMKFETYFDNKTIKEITDADIEKFVNNLTALIKSDLAPEDSKIEVVKGDDIVKWYDAANYNSVRGNLGASCMANKHPIYFGIYSKNPQVSLLILKNNDDKLVGRALLWELKNGEYFMDRVYCLTPYDENIFVKYANENNYTYRSNGNNIGFRYYRNGKEISEPKLFVELDECDFKRYPFLDSICFLNNDTSVLSNIQKSNTIELRDTDGYWIEYYDED
jgi:hypothetical protein